MPEIERAARALQVEEPVGFKPGERAGREADACPLLAFKAQEVFRESVVARRQLPLWELREHAFPCPRIGIFCLALDARARQVFLEEIFERLAHALLVTDNVNHLPAIGGSIRIPVWSMETTRNAIPLT